MSGRAFILIIILLQLAFTGYCQESHYWMTQVGARSTMLSGAVVGSVRDNSAIYYNPGAMAFIKNSSFAVMGDIYYYDYIEMENAAGDGTNLYNHILDANPQIISGVIKNPKRPLLTINYAFLNRQLSKVTLSAKNNMHYDVYESVPGEELYNGNIEYYNRLREDWLGAGYGFKLSEKFGIGFSLFLTFRSQQNRMYFDASVMNNQQTESPVVLSGSNNEIINLDYFSVGFLTKFGYAFDYENFKFGGNLTIPRLPIYFVSRASFLRSEQYLIQTLSEDTYKVSFFQRRIDVFYKSPWIIDLGANYIYNRNKYYFTLAYYSRIDKYNLIKPEIASEGSIDDILAPDDEEYSHVKIASKAVFNFALGYERKLTEQFNFLLAFSTDFNSTDWGNIDIETEYTPYYSTWDIYHFSGGFELETDRFNLTLGLNMGVGWSKNKTQIINMSSPSDDNLLKGERINNVKSKYIRSGIVLGFVYNFPGINQ